MTGRDLVVVGASAGGVEALRKLVSELPADFPAALLVVVHVAPTSPSYLAGILDRAGPLPAAPARDGQEIRSGEILVAAPDRHLIARPGHVHLVAGPRENGSRPAVDPLFRSAARAYGARVIGVVLSGTLDDGTAGLAVIRQHGGLAVVQDPATARYPGMPAAAVASGEVDHVATLDDLPALLVRLVSQPAPDVVAPPADDAPDPAEILDVEEAGDHQPHGPPSGLTCPECSGALWEEEHGGAVRYRCRVGHVYGPGALLDEQSLSLERALWTAVRVLEERADLLRRVSRRVNVGASRSADRMTEQADDAEVQADVLRAALARMPTGPVGVVGNGNGDGHGPENDD